MTDEAVRTLVQANSSTTTVALRPDSPENLYRDQYSVDYIEELERQEELRQMIETIKIDSGYTELINGTIEETQVAVHDHTTELLFIES